MDVAVSPNRVLVVDDERNCAEVVSAIISGDGCCVTEIATSSVEGLARALEETFDVIVLDLVMPDIDGMEFIRRLPADDRPEVIILSGLITVRSAVEAMKLGAFDCVPKSGEMHSIGVLVHKAAEARRRKRDVQLLSRRIEHQTTKTPFITHSPRMKDILDVVDKVAVSSVSVLLTGESGTGKELLARAIHERSGRASGPFVEVNCAALSETLLESELFGYEKGAFTGANSTRPGLVETADGGTLFLDEIGEMPPSLQAKLLRTTEDRSLYRVGGRQKIRVDIRIIGATNRNLARDIESGRFRQDLYYRLAGVEVMVPPLRERTEDVGPLAINYLTAAARQLGRGPKEISPDAMDAMRRYPWPGNVRELRNLTERLALLVEDSVVRLGHLPGDMRSGAPTRMMQAPPPTTVANGDLGLKDLERQRILRVLEEEGWHRGRAATRLHLPIRTLYRKIRAYDLLPPGWPRAGRDE
jgi:two-component system response regulator AtoC